MKREKRFVRHVVSEDAGRDPLGTQEMSKVSEMTRGMEAGDGVRDMVEAARDVDSGNGRAKLNNEGAEKT